MGSGVLRSGSGICRLGLGSGSGVMCFLSFSFCLGFGVWSLGWWSVVWGLGSEVWGLGGSCLSTNVSNLSTGPSRRKKFATDLKVLTWYY